MNNPTRTRTPASSGQIEEFVRELLEEYQPDTESKWMEILRMLSKMSISSEYSVQQKSEFNRSYVLLKSKFNEWKKHKLVSMPNNYGSIEK